MVDCTQCTVQYHREYNGRLYSVQCTVQYHGVYNGRLYSVQLSTIEYTRGDWTVYSSVPQSIQIEECTVHCALLVITSYHSALLCLLYPKLYY